MGQKTLLSFFGPAKARQSSDPNKPNDKKKITVEKKNNRSLGSSDAHAKHADNNSQKVVALEESPVKTLSKRRKSRVIESDSENDELQTADRPAGVSTSSSPTKSEDEEGYKLNSVKKSPDDCKQVKRSLDDSKPGFTPDKVPPLRKTARKQMKRKSNSLEDGQKDMVKKMKMENGKCSKPDEEDEEPMEVDEPIKNPARKKPVKIKCRKSPLKNGHKLGCQRSRDVSYQQFFSKFQASSKEEGSDSVQDTKIPSVKEICRQKEDSDKTDTVKVEGQEDMNELDDCKVESDQQDESKIDSPKEETDNALTDEESPDTKSIQKTVAEKLAKFNRTSSSPTNSNAVTNKGKKTKAPRRSKETKCKNSKMENSIKSDEKKISSENNQLSNEDDKSPIKSSSSESSPHPGDRPKRPVINPFAAKPKTDNSASGKGFNPAKANYDPIEDATWARGATTPYLALARTFECIEDTSGRLRTIEILSNLLRSVIVFSPDDLLPTVYLCLNKVAPEFAGMELNVGESLLMKAVAQVTGRSVDRIKADAKELGDLGKVAETSKSSQRMMFQPANLTIKSVFDKLKEIATMTGNAVQTKKVDKIKAMFVACRECEARYLIRSLGGKLRIGLAEQSVLQAIAQACYLTPPGQDFPPELLNAGKEQHPDIVKAKVEEFALVVKTTYCECPSYDLIVPVLLSSGVLSLPEHCQLSPGMPLKPMLAHPTKGVAEVFKRFEDNKFTCEYKYDGERAQIHLSADGTINVYSRNQEDNTTKYPDIIRRLQASLSSEVKSCILDTEAVAWDQEKKRILPFQVLSTRKRKDVSESAITVQVCVFPFDLLYLNGESLVRQPFERRRALLRDNFKEVEGEFTFAKSMDSTNTEDIQDFLEESIKGNCEGLMVKTLDVDATYEIAKRSHNWLKLKKDYLDGVGDSIDVVAIGGYMGKGKRAGQYGGFLLACYDPNNEEFQSICKIGTGFTDESLTKHSEFFKDHCIDEPKSYYRYDNNVAPDQWFDAVQVWEIKCADLSVSPVHKAAAGIVDPEKGISLRFPRFLRIRDDKSPEQATSAQQIADMYNNQDQIKNSAQDKQNNEDFY